MTIGPQCLGEGRCAFTVWAPNAERVELLLGPERRALPMDHQPRGYWRVTAEEITSGTRYHYRLTGDKVRPDPASPWQPEGVHGPSAVVDHAGFTWTDAGWRGIALENMILYELHIGTFTPEGTFDAAIHRLDDLKHLGITTLEIMPVAAFPGRRNWGYDGVYPFAVQECYGGPEGLKRLVDACHARGLAVALDVVYNHLGPEGNYFWDYGPYFTPNYRTPWGEAVNFDDAHSDEVRQYFVQNALHWFRHYHIDALRLDAIHAITDMSAVSFLADLSDEVDEYNQQNGSQHALIAESDLNDARVTRERALGGHGLHGCWVDDFHHALHTLLTPERFGYYEDFGRVKDLATSLREGFVYSGQYSTFRQRRHGNSSARVAPGRLVVFGQNHDQVGNRMNGERSSALVPFEALKLAAGAVLLSPYVPLLFMGEEYGESAPFLYFVDHADPGLNEAVRKGRRAEFRGFHWHADPPDPAAPETQAASRLNWDLRTREPNARLLEFYRTLIRLRAELPALASASRQDVDVAWDEERRQVGLMRRHRDGSVWVGMQFHAEAVPWNIWLPPGTWRKRLSSAEARWGGPGEKLPDRAQGALGAHLPGHSLVVYVEEPS